MTTQHPQEKIVKTYDYYGIKVELVEWKETFWCGKVGYAVNNTDEPDVGKITRDFLSVYDSVAAANEREEVWNVCISLNYLSGERPNGVMLGFLVGTKNQPDCFDVIELPPALYMRIPICDQTSASLGCAPWKGGIPPYEWITQRIAPNYGYKHGDDALPVFEYYGYYDHGKNEYKFCYLYVPVIEE